MISNHRAILRLKYGICFQGGFKISQRGRQPIIWPIFPQKRFKLKKNRPKGARLSPKFYYVDPPQILYFKQRAQNNLNDKSLTDVHYVILASNNVHLLRITWG